MRIMDDIPDVVPIVSDSEVSLFPIWFYGEGLNEDIAPFSGKNMEIVLCEFKNREMKWCCNLSEWHEVGRIVFEKIQKEPNYFKKIYKSVIKYCEELVKAAEKSHSQDLGKKTNKELWDIYQGFRKAMRMVVASGLVFSFIDAKTSLLSDKLIDYLNSKFDGREVAKAFTTLTTPLKDSFIKNERKSLLRLSLNIKNRIRSASKLSAEELLELINKDKTLSMRLQKHFDEYFWLPYNYEGPPWTKKDVCKLIIEHLNEKKSIEEQLKELLAEKQEIINKQKNYLKKLKPEKKFKFLFECTRDVVFLKGYRKDMQYKSYCYMENLLREIGKRFGFSLAETRFLIPREIQKLLLQNEITNKNILKQRLEYCVIVAHKKNYGVFVGKEANGLSKKIVEESIKSITELSGQCACHGEAKGIVKIVNTIQDIPKMNDGDILVSKQTNPNLVSAMKKAAAIITDTGGITSHAAIVARELRIPCVIGTQNATKILKDGDLVEVNASKGIVRKL